jgi:hypothetical protein
LIVVFLSGCAYPDKDIPDSLPVSFPASLVHPHPEKRILLIFNHGSMPEFIPDNCEPEGETTPKVVKGLNGKTVKGLEIVVYSLCTEAKTGDYDYKTRTGEPKVIKRAKNLEKVVRNFQNVDVLGEQIFLVGQSAGAWASLLVARRKNVKFNSIIAFAPGFAGRKSVRKPGWQELHDDHVEWISEAKEIKALVYAFEHDTLSPPEDLEFLKDIPGVRFLHLVDETFEGVRCNRLNEHMMAFQDCFADTQERVILDYIEERLD